MRFFKEFKEFAIKGNVFDMAVGIIIGSAFTKVVNSFVGDLIMPLLGVFIGKIDLKDLVFVLREAELNELGVVVQPAVFIAYGNLIQAGLDFTIIALSIFIVIRLFNRLRRKSENENDATVTTPRNIELLAEIRDLLKEKR